MRKEIDRVLGNSLRCILPSFWWKRLLGKMSDRIDSAESSASSAMKMATLAGLEASDKQSQLVSGSNIKTINHQSILGSGNIIVDTDNVEKYKTKDDLDANGSLAGGDIAAVVDALLVEKSFTECYQPTRSEIEANPYNKKFTKVDSISLNPDFNPNLISSNYGSLSIKLYSDGKSKGYHKEYPSYLKIECDYDRKIYCWEYDGASSTGHTLYGSSGFNAAKIDRVNNILREGDFRFSYFEATYREDVNVNSYTYYYSYNDNFPADATATIDSFVKMLFAETQNADIYVRSAEWVKLLKEGDVTGGGADITIDSELSDTSENAVQNKVITAELNKKANKTEIPTKMSQLEQDVEIGSSYDDRELREAIANLEETKVDNPVVFSTEKLGDPVYSEETSLFWSAQQAENAFGMPYAEIYEDVKKRGVVFGDNNPSLYAFQSMEEDEQLVYCFNISTADSKTKNEYWLVFYKTPEAINDIEVAIVLSTIMVDLSYDDTDVKNELARLEREKADKSELTELSAEVGGLSEKVDELGEGGSEIFVAEYGITTYEEIAEAMQTYKEAVCEYQKLHYRLVSLDGGATFTTDMGNYHYRLVCSLQNRWSNAYFNRMHSLENLANGNVKVTIEGKTAKVATPQYVENAIQQSGGGGGGGSTDKPFALLYETTIAEETSSLDVLAAVPNILDYKTFAIETELVTGDNTGRTLKVCFYSGNSNYNYCELQGINKQTYQTFYRIWIQLANSPLGCFCYSESHNNSWNNQQKKDGMQGLNLMIMTRRDLQDTFLFPINAFNILCPFKVGDKIRIYGK